MKPKVAKFTSLEDEINLSQDDYSCIVEYYHSVMLYLVKDTALSNLMGYRIEI